MTEKITYHDFEEFVRNRPQPDTPGFYKLIRLQSEASGYERHEVDDISLNERLPIKGGMWRFPVKRLSEMDFEYYPTFEEAYAAMMERDGIDDSVVYTNPKLSSFGYRILQLGFGAHSTRDFFVQYWNYDADRREYDRSSCSSYHWNLPGVCGKFLGRLPEQISFKKGDIVEISVSKYKDKGKLFSTLGVIIGQPRSVKEVWESIDDEINEHVLQNETIESYFCEPDSDGVDEEEYFILFGPYDESMLYATFQHPIEVRPPSFPVPEEAREELMKYYNEYQQSLKSND